MPPHKVHGCKRALADLLDDLEVLDGSRRGNLILSSLLVNLIDETRLIGSHWIWCGDGTFEIADWAYFIYEKNYFVIFSLLVNY